MSFPMNVDGCCLKIPGLYSSLMFSTPSNALFASLFMKHANLPLQLFDDLLELFRLSKFRTEDVTFQNPEDIIDQLSEQRRSIANKRAEKANITTSSSNRIPQIIIEHVAEHFDTQRTPFHRVYKKTYPECDADRSLRAMALVHPSWTESAQRCLRRRVFIGSLPGLHKMCEGTQLGPWVRELCFRRSATCSRVCNLDVIDASRLLCVVLQKCPNVRQLSLTDFLPVRIYDHCEIHGLVLVSSDPRRDVSRQLAQCRYLEDLWLTQGGEPTTEGLAGLCTLLLRLTALKSLHLNGWGWMNEQAVAIYPSNTESLNATLTTLSILNMTDSPFLAFLARTQDWGLLTTLEISLVDMTRSEDFHPFLLASEYMSLLQPITSGITRLCIRDWVGEHDVSTFVQQFLSLEALRLQASSFSGLPIIPLNLPPPTLKLHIHLVVIPLGSDQDTLALASLTACPQIRNFIITSLRATGPEGGDIERPTFSTTSEYCSRNNVEFEIMEIDYFPSVLDL